MMCVSTVKVLLYYVCPQHNSGHHRCRGAQGSWCSLCLWAVWIFMMCVCGACILFFFICVLYFFCSIQKVFKCSPRCWEFNENTSSLQMRRQNKFNRMCYDNEVCVPLFVCVHLCGRDHVSLYVCVLPYLCVSFVNYLWLFVTSINILSVT